ncbi:MAG: helix-turn-helix domain-containing protein [Cyclobacteriaceae bacterium]|nr:helix-turn-helix domain-containing protein [Cyclobacteriaceae bacterium]
MDTSNSNDNNLKRSSTYRDQLLTIGDLEAVKNELLLEIKSVLKTSNGQSPKQWLRTSEVRKILGVSPGTLQNLRVNRTLSYTKIGGIVFYKHDDILKLLEDNCITRKDNNG